MKESGISWVGEIPKEWSVKKIKHISYVIGGNGFNVELQGLESGDYPFCKASDISNAGKYLDKAANYVTFDIVRDQHYNIIPKGAILFPKIGEAMKKNNRTICVLDCCVDNNCQAIVPFERNSGMFLYYILTCVNMGWFDNAGTIPCMNNRKFLNSKVPFPSLVEQQRIAEFLDRECGKIDGLKADIQAQIDTLEQYKRSVITEAVTHGLNPSAPMKDSGIPWVGNIPKHWNCCSLKYNYNTISGATPNSNDISLWDGEIVWVTPADYKTKDVYVFSGARKITYKGYLSCSTTLIKQGNIIFSKRAPIGSVAINKVELCTSQGCLSVVRKTGNVNNKYFYYLFSVNDETFNLFGSGTTFKEISAKDFLSVKFPLPPLDEQQEIADYLDNKCAEIERIIADKKLQMETLDGYKKSLIYEYVTGKKEVV